MPLSQITDTARRDIAHMRGSSLFRWGGGPGNVFILFVVVFQSSTYFTEGRTDLPQEAIGPDREVRIRIYKETYSHF